MRRKGPKKKSKNSTHSFKILKPYTLHPYLKKKKKKIVTSLVHLFFYYKRNLLKEFKSLYLQVSITRDKRPPLVSYIIPWHSLQILSIASQLELLNT